MPEQKARSASSRRMFQGTYLLAHLSRRFIGTQPDTD